MVAEFYSAAGVPSVGSSSQGGNWEELNRKYMLKSHSRHSRKLRLRWNTETHTAGGGGVTAIRGGEVGGDAQVHVDQGPELWQQGQSHSSLTDGAGLAKVLWTLITVRSKHDV